MNRSRARAALAIAMVGYGTIAIFVAAIPLSSAMRALMRAVIAAALLLVFGAVRGKPLKVRGAGRDLVWLLLSGAAMGFNWILLFEAYRYTTVSVATLSYYFAPVLVMLASAFLFREPVTRRQALCFVGATVGLVLVIHPRGAADGQGLIGVGFGLGAAALYATVVLLNKRIRGVTGLDRTVWQFLAAIVVLTPYVLLTEGISFAGMDRRGWLALATLGVVHTGICYVLYFSALKELPGQETAVLSYIDPLVAMLVSVCWFHEPLAAVQLLGGALLLGFTLLNEIG